MVKLRGCRTVPQQLAPRASYTAAASAQRRECTAPRVHSARVRTVTRSDYTQARMTTRSPPRARTASILVGDPQASAALAAYEQHAGVERR